MRRRRESSEETASSLSPADAVTDIDLKTGSRGERMVTADQMTFPVHSSSGPHGRKWWDPIADVIFPHRRVARRQQLRRNNSLDPRARTRFMHGYPVHPVPPPHMYPPYPPPPHPFPYYGMPPHPMHFPPPPMAMHGHPAAYPPHGYYPPPLNEDGEDLQSEVSIMDPSFYTSPGLESYRRGSAPPNIPRGGRKKRSVPPPPLIATPPSSFIDKSNMVEYDSEREGQDRTTLSDDTAAPESDIKGFDSFMMY